MLSDRLIKLRKEHNFTQQRVADYLGITRPAYTAYERGTRQPDYETLLKLADYYDVTIDYLLGRENTQASITKEEKPLMLGEKLKKLRGKRTQEEVAKFIGVSRARYSHYENGRSEPDTETLKKIASFYNVSVDYLLGLEVNEEKVPYHTSNQNNAYSEQPELLLTPDELKVLQEIKKHPVLFHDLANAPEKKIKQLIKMWKFIKQDLEDDEEEEGFGDIED